MSRIARWRQGAHDPTSVGRWLLAGGGVPVSGYEKPNKRRVKALLIGVGIYLLVCACVVLFSPGLVRWLPILNLIVPIVNVASLVRREEPNDAWNGSREEGAIWIQMRVLSEEGWTTGSDRGWLVHCDGWLLFEGDRTSFAFTRAEAQRSRYESPNRIRLIDGRSLALSSVGTTVDSPIEKIIDDWRGASFPQGEAILPPIEIHTEVWAKRWTFWSLGTFASLAIAVAAFFSGASAGVWLACFGALACLKASRTHLKEVRASLTRTLAQDSVPVGIDWSVVPPRVADGTHTSRRPESPGLENGL